MIQLHRPSVIAIVVTYQPDINVFGQLLDSLSTQVSAIVIVDNGSDKDLHVWASGRGNLNTEVISLNENMGIAVAHNMGFQRAKNKGAKFVLLMDQDSIPSPDMLGRLLDATLALPSMAIVGPRYLDGRQDNPPPFIRVRGLHLERCTCSTEASVVPVDYLISSGCLIPVLVLDKVGGMREDLFIDYVDIEWGLRARFHGFQSYGVCSAHMQHNLGELPIKFFNRNIPLHSPIRHYYHFRNALLLYKTSWIPLNWKLVDGWRLCLKFVFYSLFTKQPMSHFFMMTLGLWHGLINKTGKLH